MSLSGNSGAFHTESEKRGGVGIFVHAIGDGLLRALKISEIYIVELLQSRPRGVVDGPAAVELNILWLGLIDRWFCRYLSHVLYELTVVSPRINHNMF